MKKYIIIACFLGFYAKGIAQQTPLFSLIDDNITMINPAAYRSEFMFDDYSFFVNTTYRSQWTGLDYAPKTTLVQVSSWLPDWTNWDKFGDTRVGFDFMMDDIDPLKIYGFYGQMAHKVTLNKNYNKESFLSGGLNLGFVAYNLNTANLVTYDPMLSEINGSSATLDAGLGIMYGWVKEERNNRRTDKTGYYVGLSIPQITGLNFNIVDDGRGVNIDRVQHYYAIAGGQFGSYDRLKVRPTVMLNYAHKSPLHFDGRVEIQPIEYLWAGVGGSTTNKSLSFRIGGKIPYSGGFAGDTRDTAIRIGASYTHFLSDVYKLGGTYEVTIAWMVDNYQ